MKDNPLCVILRRFFIFLLGMLYIIVGFVWVDWAFVCANQQAVIPFIFLPILKPFFCLLFLPSGLVFLVLGGASIGASFSKG